MSTECRLLDSCYLVEILRDTLKDIVGTYTYKNGYKIAAIAVGKTPEDVSCDGLEVIVPMIPDLVDSEITSTNIIELQKWKILLLDRAQGANLRAALIKLKQLSAKFTYIYLPITARSQYPTLVFNLMHYQSLLP